MTVYERVRRQAGSRTSTQYSHSSKPRVELQKQATSSCVDNQQVSAQQNRSLVAGVNTKQTPFASPQHIGRVSGAVQRCVSLSQSPNAIVAGAIIMQQRACQRLGLFLLVLALVSAVRWGPSLLLPTPTI
jgi:hypothetical protein